MPDPQSIPARPPDWFTEIIAEAVDPEQPGLYEWRIGGVGVYVGKYRWSSRPRREYANNVAKLLGGRPYRKSKPGAFRRIHVELAEAVRAGRKITLTLLENVTDPALRHRREQELIEERRIEAIRGGLPVLNAS